MATDVSICNLALSHLGDRANVASIDPPDQSAQAGHCATFYPIARDALLEMHPWGFATKRQPLALLDSATPAWAYTYAAPSDVVNYLVVKDVNATDEWSTVQPMAGTSWSGSTAPAPHAIYTPQPFKAGILDDGTPVIFTNQQDAELVYSAIVTNAARFSPLFVSTLSYLLASYLAGPILKGAEGRAVAKEMKGMALVELGKAATSDSNQQRSNIAQAVPWMVNR